MDGEAESDFAVLPLSFTLLCLFIEDVVLSKFLWVYRQAWVSKVVVLLWVGGCVCSSKVYKGEKTENATSLPVFSFSLSTLCVKKKKQTTKGKQEENRFALN